MPLPELLTLIGLTIIVYYGGLISMWNDKTLAKMSLNTRRRWILFAIFWPVTLIGGFILYVPLRIYQFLKKRFKKLHKFWFAENPLDRGLDIHD